MGFRSFHVERVATFTRLLGTWSLFLGFILVGWAVLAFPWRHRDRTADDAQYASIAPDAAVAPSSDDPNSFKGPATPVASEPNASIPTARWVDTYDPRYARYEVGAILITYIFPGIVLVILARFMARLDLWAYAAALLLCLGFVVYYGIELISMLAPYAPLHAEPLLTETMLRPAALILAALCLNALPDAEGEFRIRSRRRQHGFEPIMPAPLPASTTPQPVNVLQTAERGSR